MNDRIGDEVRYDDIEALKSVLVGHKIVSVREDVNTSNLAGYSHGSGSLEYTLDDGTILYALDADGGCACTNGCFWLVPGEVPQNVITDVEQIEESNPDEYDTAIRLFVYSEGVKTQLFWSHGDDNGYYGWGHHIVISKPKEDK